MPKISCVWRHFDKKNIFSAVCKICCKILKTGGNTTNLRQHLQTIHHLKLDRNDPDDPEDVTDVSKILK